MSNTARSMPQVMRDLHEMEFDYADGEGIDFEPYSEFLSVDGTRDWIRAWTGNDELDGLEYRVFGQDGTGGFAAFWCVRPGAPVLDQPVVFLGSEGQGGVIARSFADYLWLLAGGVGPCEAVAQPEHDGPGNAAFEAFATAHAANAKKTASDVIAAANAEFPEFDDTIAALIR